MSWEAEYTDQFEEWWVTLSEQEQTAIDKAVEALQQDGPSLHRPLVDTVHRSRYADMKELRPPSSTIRILFAFDPQRSAILLIGGDKAGQWNAWYERMIPVADRLYDDHLQELHRQGDLP